MRRMFVAALVFIFVIGTSGPEARSEMGEYDAESLMTPERIGDEDFGRYGIEEKMRSGELRCTVGLLNESSISCHYHRMIGEATVEGDHLYYDFDRETLELLNRGIHWRDDLPDELPGDLLTAGEAAEYDVVRAVQGGEVTSAALYYLSPESNVFPLDSVTGNPCRVVQIREHGPCVGKVMVIIDAVTGEFLGYGSEPPQSGHHVYHIPHVVAGDGRWSGMGILAGDYYESTNISMAIRRGDGTLISSDDRVMGPREQLSFVVGSDAPMEGWMRITSDLRSGGSASPAARTATWLTCP